MDEKSGDSSLSYEYMNTVEENIENLLMKNKKLNTKNYLEVIF